MSFEYESGLDKSSDLELSLGSITVSGGGGRGADEDRLGWEKLCVSFEGFSGCGRCSGCEDELVERSDAFSEGLRGGGGECGSFLIGTRLGTGGGG